MTLRRCDGSPGGLNSSLQLCQIAGTQVDHLPLNNTPVVFDGVEVWGVSWPRKHTDMMVSKLGSSCFGAMCRC